MSSNDPSPTEDAHTVSDAGGQAIPAQTGDKTAATQPASSLPRSDGLPGSPHPVPGFHAVRKLGEGAYGAVWLYVDERTGVQVAVKFFAHGTGQEWLLVQAEVKQLALMHADPGIVQLRDVELEADPPYYVMTYAPGGSLATRLHDGKRFHPAEAVKVLREAAEALAYVHAKGVRHCDLKPGNILLDARGRALVADFGQAHLISDASPALGTFFYMAPEQADLNPSIPDTRWDVYGLGAVIYTLLTGNPPFETDAIRKELGQFGDLARRLKRYRDWVRQAPRPTAHRRAPGMDASFAAVIDRCLEVDPEKRFRDAGAVLDALKLRDRRRRQRPLLLFGLVAPLLLLIAMALGGWFLLGMAVQDSEAALSGQVLERNKLMAQVMAQLVDAKLKRRTDIVASRAADPDLERAVRDGQPRERLAARLEKFRETDQDLYFFKWTVADAAGHIVADDPQEKELWDQGQSWAWRDWFSGGGHKFHHQGEPFPAHEGVYVSQPYVGVGVDEKGRPDPVIISISAPLKDPDDPSKTVGLLAGTMHVADLYDWVLAAGFNEKYGFPVLINDRRHILAHRDREAVNRKIRPRDDANPEPLESKLIRDMTEGRQGSGVDGHYVDPLDGRTYLAGYAPAESSRWVVLVQQDREAALQPTRRLRERLTWYGVIALAAAAALTSLMWVWLIRMLRRSDAA
ncbi:MAG TPA: serine/threonine protein kinase [Gemmataceae bacterium]|nr:serine/threonine protein kinase [Gemmataceae bacterium]